MPGSRALRKAKEPPAPVVYEVSPEVGEVMHRLVRLNPVQFGWVNNFKLAGVIVRGARPKEQGGCVVLARFVKVPPLWHGLTGYDAVIRVEDWAWRRLDATGQEALVTHELCHGSMSDKGSLRVMRHDLEEFGFVVRKYGAWQEGIALFDRQLSMFDGAPLAPAPSAGEQTVVPFRAKAPRPAETPVEEASRMLGEVVTAVVEDALDGPELAAAPEDHPLWTVVSRGESLDDARVRIQHSKFATDILESEAVRTLLAWIGAGRGAEVPFPRGGAS